MKSVRTTKPETSQLLSNYPKQVIGKIKIDKDKCTELSWHNPMFQTSSGP